MAWHFGRAGNWSNSEWKCSTCQAKGKHEQRHCKKFPKPKPVPSWRAAVKIKDKAEKVIDGTQVNECPVTYITPDSLQMMEFVQINRVTKQSGALFGPDTGRWPAWLVDATVCIEAAQAAEEEARNR